MRKNQAKRSTSQRERNEDDELLWPFRECKDDRELADYMLHCGITGNDFERCGTLESTVRDHYRRLAPTHEGRIACAANDLLRWPPIAARVRELQTSS